MVKRANAEKIRSLTRQRHGWLRDGVMEKIRTVSRHALHQSRWGECIVSCNCQRDMNGAIFDIAHGDVGYVDIFEHGTIHLFHRQAQAIAERAVGKGDVLKCLCDICALAGQEKAWAIVRTRPV